MTYLVTETPPPISVTTTHHLTPAVWGFVMILNPLLVTFFQLRLTLDVGRPGGGEARHRDAVDERALPAAERARLRGVIAFVVVVFVIGDALADSQALVAALVADIRGALGRSRRH
jgi:hypothetical protein